LSATTGFEANQLAEIKRLARRRPTLLSANTSLGVNVLVAVLGKAAQMLGDDLRRRNRRSALPFQERRRAARLWL
jgi:dihydrodipicolinate reductase